MDEDVDIFAFDETTPGPAIARGIKDTGGFGLGRLSGRKGGGFTPISCELPMSQDIV